MNIKHIADSFNIGSEERKEILSLWEENKRLRSALEEIGTLGWSERFGGGYQYTGENHAECIRKACKALSREE